MHLGDKSRLIFFGVGQAVDVSMFSNNKSIQYSSLGDVIRYLKCKSIRNILFYFFNNSFKLHWCICKKISFVLIDKYRFFIPTLLFIVKTKKYSPYIPMFLDRN